MRDMQIGCALTDAAPWINIPFDVKSDKDTTFGEVLWSATNGRGVVSPMPEPEQIAEHYDLDSYYTQGASSHMPDVPVTFLDKVLTRLAWRADEPGNALADDIAHHRPQGGRLLDIGCGKGALMADLAVKGFDVAGVEPDPAARQAGADAGMQIMEGTAEDLPSAAQTANYDVITLTHVLEHCIQPETALQNIRHAMADDGLFYCEVPNCGATYFQRYAQISEMLDVPRHLHFFTKQALNDMCHEAGLKVIDWRYHGYTRHFTASWRAWENGIHDRIKARGLTPQCGQRSFLASLKLIRDTAKLPPDQKFDCIGFFAVKA